MRLPNVAGQHMIKKVTVDKLKAGFFVHDFNCGWLYHPLLKNCVKLHSDQDIEQFVRYGIREVYIDTEKGLDVEDAPTRHEVDSAIHSEMAALAPAVPQRRSETPLTQQISRANALILEAKRATQRMMDDVRLGKQINIRQAETVVERMTESVLGDADALVTLLRIKSNDEYTYRHSLAVSALCISFGQSMGFDAVKLKDIGIGGLLHDIGELAFHPAEDQGREQCQCNCHRK